MKLRCGEDKNNVLGRFLKRFQKRVERADRKHVHLVDYINALFQH